MYIYIDPDGNYPRYPGDIILQNPTWSNYDKPPKNWSIVNEIDPPQIFPNQRLIENYPVNIDGQYYQSWSVADLTREELEERQRLIESLNKPM